MSRQLKCVFLASLVGAIGWSVGQASAATVSYFGVQSGVADNARTSTVAKPLDADGDNVLGSAGYLFFETVATGSGTSNNGGATIATNATSFGSNADVSVPSYLTVSAAQTLNLVSESTGAFTNIDDVSNPPNNVRSGILYVNIGTNATYDLLKLTVNAGFPAAGLRVGVMTDNFNREKAASYALVQTTGGTGTATTPTLTVAASYNFDNDFYFFDLTNVVAGDVFTLRDTTGAAGSNAGFANIGGLTFDVIPEPSGLGMLGLAIGSWAGLRRRRAAGRA